MKFIKKLLSTIVLVFVGCCVVALFFGSDDTEEDGGRSSVPAESSAESVQESATETGSSGTFGDGQTDEVSDTTEQEQKKIIEIPDLSTIEHDDDYIRPEFRKAMEEYVEFYREYCDFLKTYNESDNALAMYADYMDILKQLAEYEDAIAEIGETDMTLAETSLYIDANAEIQKMLLELY